MKIYAYTMTYNTGFAPCVSNKIMSLACCKTILRYRIAKEIENGEKDIYVIGLCGKQLARRNGIGVGKYYSPVYIAKVADCVKCHDYYSKTDRPDKKYVFKDGNWRILPGNPHENEIDTDIYYNFRNIHEENYVLIFEEYIYAGNKLQDIDTLPKLFDKIKSEREKSPRSNTTHLGDNDINCFVTYFNNNKKKIENDRKLVVDEYFVDSCRKGCEGRKNNK